MQIDISNKNPYDAVADVIIDNQNPSSAYIARIKTTVLGESNELLVRVASFPDVWEWDSDWYEGGEVELLGYIAIDNIVGDTGHTANWIECP